MAAFVDFCSSHSIAQPPDKIVKNLCTFLCQDAEQTPTFAFTRKYTDGILSFQATAHSASQAKEIGKDKDKVEPDKMEEVRKARLSRRGAGLAFDQLSSKFGPHLFDVIPNMWPSMAGGLVSTFQAGDSSNYTLKR